MDADDDLVNRLYTGLESRFKSDVIFFRACKGIVGWMK